MKPKVQNLFYISDGIMSFWKLKLLKIYKWTKKLVIKKVYVEQKLLITAIIMLKLKKVTFVGW